MAKKRIFAIMKIAELFQILNEIIHSPETLIKSRLSEKYFTRNRKMSFVNLLCFFFDMRKTSLQTRLNLFFKREKHSMMSEQALSKARNHFDHSPFETMVRRLVSEEYSGKNSTLTWHGYHVLADDGSYLQLPKATELSEIFGTRGQGNHCVSAGVSVLYDVITGWPIDPAITHSNMNERAELMKHLDYLSGELPHIAEKSVLLIDRGYSSEEVFKAIESKRMKFLARCKSNYCKKTQMAPLGDSIVKLNHGLIVRVFKFALPSGEIETLLTNLFDIPSEELPKLYSKRWGIETAYHRLKNIICLENFSGKTENAIRQDFWASMVLMISVAVFQKEANEKIERAHRRKQNKHQYKASVGDLAVTLRDEFIFAVLRKNKILSIFKIRKIVALLAYSKSPVRPERSFPRHKNRNPAFNLNLKSHL